MLQCRRLVVRVRAPSLRLENCTSTLRCCMYLYIVTLVCDYLGKGRSPVGALGGPTGLR